jgi:hypothetical protein
VFAVRIVSRGGRKRQGKWKVPRLSECPGCLGVGGGNSLKSPRDCSSSPKAAFPGFEGEEEKSRLRRRREGESAVPGDGAAESPLKLANVKGSRAGG